MDISPAGYYRLAALVSAGAALAALWRCLSSLRRNRLLVDTPLAKIRSAAQGYVKFYGRAAPAEAGAMAAPLSSRPCVWWSYSISQQEDSSDAAAAWNLLESATSVDLFVLSDGDAECLVGPVNAEITPTTDDVWYGPSPRPNGPPAREHIYQSRDYRYTEKLLSPGDALSVLGELRSHSDIGSGMVTATQALLQDWKRDQKALLARFDANHDGRIDTAEWDTARSCAAEESQLRVLSRPVTRLSVISEPTHGEPFLIAPMDSLHLVRRERLRAALYFCLGLIFSMLCAGALQHT
jgi:hypothetical protein